MNEPFARLNNKLRAAASYMDAIKEQQVDAIIDHENVYLLRIKNNEKKFSQLIENLQEIVFQLDPQGRYEYISPSAKLSMGIDPLEIVGQTIYSIPFSPEVRKTFADNFARVLKTAEPAIFSFEYPTPHGTGIFQTKLFPGIDRNQEVERVFGITTDITEHRSVEKDLKDRDEHLELALESSNLGTFEYDPEQNRIIRCNNRLFRIFELPGQSVEGMDKILEAVHPVDRFTLLNALNPGLEERKIKIEIRLMPTDGKVKWIQISGRCLPQLDNYKQRIIGIVEDITEKKINEDYLISSAQTAEQANRSKSSFLANLSHEVRTPLTTILGYTDILLEDIDHKEKEEIVKGINSCSKLLLSLMNNVLDLSKIESGKVEINPVVTCPGVFLEEVVSLVKPAARDKDLSLRVSTGSGLPQRLIFDSEKVKQILVNLLSNGIKYTQKGSVELKADYLPEQSILKFSVRDTGAGIRRGFLHELFEPFKRDTNSITNDKVGTGLGLAISRELAKSLSGTIVLERSSEKGSVFSFSLPVEMDDQPPKRVGTDLEKDLLELNKIKDLSALVVDDQEEVRSILKHYLNSCGCESVETADGDRVLGLINRGSLPFDLIFLDLAMPGLNGFQIVRKLRKSGFRGPVIASTAHIEGCQKEDFKQAGFTDSLRKPIDIKELADVIKRNA